MRIEKTYFETTWIGMYREMAKLERSTCVIRVVAIRTRMDTCERVMGKNYAEEEIGEEDNNTKEKEKISRRRIIICI